MKGLILFFSILSTLSFAQKDTQEQLVKHIEQLDSKTKKSGNYSCNGKHVFFNSLTDSDTSFSSTYSVQFDKKRNVLNVQQLNQFVIQDEQIMIVIDSARKQIILNKPNEAFTSPMGAVELKKAVKHIVNITYSKKNKQEIYTVNYDSVSPLEKVELFFSADGNLAKVISYAGYAIPDPSQGRDVMIQPRMEVFYNKYAFGEKVNTLSMTVPTDVYDASKKALTERYKDFQLIELRYNPTTK